MLVGVNPENCAADLNLLILMDGSGSMRPTGFQTELVSRCTDPPCPRSPDRTHVWCALAIARALTLVAGWRSHRTL